MTRPRGNRVERNPAGRQPMSRGAGGAAQSRAPPRRLLIEVRPPDAVGKAAPPASWPAAPPLMKGLGIDASPHGARSSFRNWAAENGQAPHVSEKVLGRAVPSAVLAAYLTTDFFDLRKPIMQEWGITSGRPWGQ